MMTSHTITLAHPVDFDGEIVASISIRPPTEADFAAVHRMNARAEVKAMQLVSRLTGFHWRYLAQIEAANDGTLAQIDHLLAPEKGG